MLQRALQRWVIDMTASEGGMAGPITYRKYWYYVVNYCIGQGDSNQKLKELRKIVAVIGVEELSAEDRDMYTRGLLMQNYMTQPFFVGERYTGKKGAFVQVADALDDCEGIITGEFDDWDPQDMYMIGTVAEFKKAKGRE